MEALFNAESLIALGTLTLLEIVLGIDNVIFISILASKLPQAQRAAARQLGIGLAVAARILLLLVINWVIGLTEPLFSLLEHGFSGRDLILLGGGLFLIGKSTFEIHDKLEAVEHGMKLKRAAVTFASVIAQIVVIDMVFSLDSVITAVGISGELIVMIPAICVAAIVMIIFAGAVSRFVEQHPTMKVLALAFLILIGSLLVIEGWDPEVVHDHHLKNYAYFAMLFSFLVEVMNLRVRRSGKAVELRNRPHLDESSS